MTPNERTFMLNAPASLVLRLRYQLDQGTDYESDEISQALAGIDGVLVALPPSDYLAQVAGNRNRGTTITAGWRLVEIPLGTLAAGSHSVTLGGYNSKKNGWTERTTILIDDAIIVVR